MTQLPEAINHTISAIYDAYEAKGSDHSGDSRGVPMSDVANECERAVWYGFSWASFPEKIDGVKQSRFDTGLLEEKRLLERTRIGWNVKLSALIPPQASNFVLSWPMAGCGAKWMAARLDCRRRQRLCMWSKSRATTIAASRIW